MADKGTEVALTGKRVTYHGSIDAVHGETFFVLSECDCHHCLTALWFSDKPNSDYGVRYRLGYFPDDEHAELVHVRRKSFTLAD